MSPEELERELGAGRIRPAYLVAGGEALLRERALAALRAAILVEGTPETFNSDRFDGDSADPAALRNALATAPVLAPRRLVWLREPLAAGTSGAGRALLEALPQLVREQLASTTSVLVVSSSRVDRRAAWARSFETEPAAVIECEAPRSERARLAFLRSEAARLGVKLDREAARLLLERVGADLLRLRGELEKAALVAGGGRIDAEAVLEASAESREEPIWELTDAIGEGNVERALECLARLLAAGVPEPVVLGSLARHLRRLLRLRAGEPLRGPSFLRRKLEAQAARLPSARLLACLSWVHETDEALKGKGAVSADLALERLVLALAS